jgi:hypothetical protein
MFGKEALDARQGRNERAGEVWEWRCADDHQQTTPRRMTASRSFSL